MVNFVFLAIRRKKLPSFPNFQPTTLIQPWTQQPKTTDPACWPAVIGSLIKSRSSAFTLSTNSLRISTINPKERAVPPTTCCWTWRKWKLFSARGSRVGRSGLIGAIYFGGLQEQRDRPEIHLRFSGHKYLLHRRHDRA